MNPFWRLPWSYGPSFLVAFLLLLMGLLLEMLTGSRGLGRISWPLNLYFGLALVTTLLYVHFFYKKHPFTRWLSSIPAAVSSIVLVAFLVMLLGFIPQNNNASPAWVKILGFGHLKISWVFLIAQFYLLITLGFVTLRRSTPLKGRNVGFFLNHAGLWITVVAATLGTGDLQRLTLELHEGKGFNHFASDEQGRMYQIPFAVELVNFEMEVYNPKLAVIKGHTGEIVIDKGSGLAMIDSGVSVRFGEWEIQIDKYLPDAWVVESQVIPAAIEGAAPMARIVATNGPDTVRGWISSGSFAQSFQLLPLDKEHSVAMTVPEAKKYASLVNTVAGEQKTDSLWIEVNKPLKVNRWKLYQVSYDDKRGKYSSLSVIEAIRDPWLPVVYLGFFMLLAGAIYLFWIGKDIKEEQE